MQENAVVVLLKVVWIFSTDILGFNFALLVSGNICMNADQLFLINAVVNMPLLIFLIF